MKLLDNCPDDWDEFQDSCYKYHEELEVTFTEAVTICKELNADVLVINSKEEDQFIKGLIAEHDYVWLGMKMSGDLDGSWEVLNGEEPSYNRISYRDTSYFMSNHGYGSYPGGYHNTPRFGSICAVFVSDRWVPILCSDKASVMCKRPISG